MRTVHETEALRPSDPVPRNYSSAHFKPQRLKLILNSKPPTGPDAEGQDDETLSPGSVTAEDVLAPPFEYPSDIQFTDEELTMRPDQLFRLLRRQVFWSEEDGKELFEEVRGLEKMRKEEWMAKELVLANLMEAELAVAHSKGESEANVTRILEDLPKMPLPLSGKDLPWYRQVEEFPLEEADEQEAEL